MTPGPTDGERLRARGASDERPRARPVMRQVWRHLGFLHWPIDGAYFLLADLRARGVTDDVAFCRRLIAEVGVAAIPTSVFYAEPAAAPPFARFCFAKSDETLLSAAARLSARRLPAP